MQEQVPRLILDFYIYGYARCIENILVVTGKDMKMTLNYYKIPDPLLKKAREINENRNSGEIKRLRLHGGRANGPPKKSDARALFNPSPASASPGSLRTFDNRSGSMSWPHVCGQ